MKVEVIIPGGRYCRGCPLLQTILDSFGYEETHEWCAYLKEDLNTPSEMYAKNIKKHRNCPYFKQKG